MKRFINRHALTGRKGLTLLELVLAMMVLSVLLLAGSQLSVSAVRLTASVSEEMRLRNELQYVFRDIVLHTRTGRSPSTAVANCPTNCLRVTHDTQPGVVTVDYLYDEQARVISRRITDADGTARLDVLSSGVLIRRNGEDAPPVSVFEIPDPRAPLVEVHLGAEAVLHDSVVRVPVITKSILLRG